MPKAKKKKVSKPAKRTVTCGKCKATGHNARTCPTSEAPVQEAVEPKIQPEVKKPAISAPKVLAAAEPTSRMNTVPKRSAPTAGNTSENNFAPYRCPHCTQVAILVAIRIKDHQASFKKGCNVYTSELRCEKCFNTPPAELILKWGARPGEKVPVSQDNA